MVIRFRFAFDDFVCGHSKIHRSDVDDSLGDGNQLLVKIIIECMVSENGTRAKETAEETN